MTPHLANLTASGAGLHHDAVPRGQYQKTGQMALRNLAFIGGNQLGSREVSEWSR